MVMPTSLSSAGLSISCSVTSMSGSTPAASHASREFSTSSRIVVYRLFPGLSKPAMFLFSEKNSAGDFTLSTSPRAVRRTPAAFGAIEAGKQYPRVRAPAN